MIRRTGGRPNLNFKGRLCLMFVCSTSTSACTNSASRSTRAPATTCPPANARIGAGPPPERGKFLRIVPNLVVEILSRATSRRDRSEKKDVYERNGIAEYWIVDPDKQAVTVFALTHGTYDAGQNVQVRVESYRACSLPSSRQSTTCSRPSQPSAISVQLRAFSRS